MFGRDWDAYCVQSIRWLADRQISVTIDTPYVGQGVAKGTAVVMHGVKVGEVTDVANLAGGSCSAQRCAPAGPATRLTSTMNFDFRPVNYFGVTGINIMPNTGGQALRDGMRINTVPKGNFTLQALLYRFGEVSAGVLTPQLIQVTDRATRYLDALDPLVETMLITANAVAESANGTYRTTIDQHNAKSACRFLRFCG